MADLAIVDVQLPDLEGFEVAERLGALELAPEVILATRASMAPISEKR